MATDNKNAAAPVDPSGRPIDSNNDAEEYWKGMRKAASFMAIISARYDTDYQAAVDRLAEADELEDKVRALEADINLARAAAALPIDDDAEDDPQNIAALKTHLADLQISHNALSDVHTEFVARMEDPNTGYKALKDQVEELTQDLKDSRDMEAAAKLTIAKAEAKTKQMLTERNRALQQAQKSAKELALAKQSSDIGAFLKWVDTHQVCAGLDVVEDLAAHYQQHGANAPHYPSKSVMANFAFFKGYAASAGTSLAASAPTASTASPAVGSGTAQASVSSLGSGSAPASVSSSTPTVRSPAALKKTGSTPPSAAVAATSSKTNTGSDVVAGSKRSPTGQVQAASANKKPRPDANTADLKVTITKPYHVPCRSSIATVDGYWTHIFVNNVDLCKLKPLLMYMQPAAYEKLIQAAPWDDCWDQRIRDLHVWRAQFAQDSKVTAWIESVYRWMYIHRMALWERRHWLYMPSDTGTAEGQRWALIYNARKMRSRKVKAELGDILKQLATLIPKDTAITAGIWVDPSIWRLTSCLNWFPEDPDDLVADYKRLDSAQPGLRFWIDAPRQHPFWRTTTSKEFKTPVLSGTVLLPPHVPDTINAQAILPDDDDKAEATSRRSL